MSRTSYFKSASHVPEKAHVCPRGQNQCLANLRLMFLQSCLQDLKAHIEKKSKNPELSPDNQLGLDNLKGLPTPRQLFPDHGEAHTKNCIYIIYIYIFGMCTGCKGRNDPYRLGCGHP